MARNTEGFEELLDASPALRKEFEESGSIQTYVPYVPTDWGKTTPAEQREFWGGFREQDGYCPKCHILRARNGACECE